MGDCDGIFIFMTHSIPDAIEGDMKCGGSDLKDCSLAAGIFSPIAPVFREKVGIAFFDQVRCCIV